jgi:hypothetical protein
VTEPSCRLRRTGARGARRMTPAAARDHRTLIDTSPDSRIDVSQLETSWRRDGQINSKRTFSPFRMTNGIAARAA